LSSTLLLVRFSSPSVSVEEVLNKAVASERVSGTPDQISHRSLLLEERNLGSGETKSRRIEIWQSATPFQGRIKVRKVVDEDGVLIAGEWTQEDGTRLLYDTEAGLRAAAVIETRGAAYLISQLDQVPVF
jgi:hypothetical protein